MIHLLMIDVSDEQAHAFMEEVSDVVAKYNAAAKPWYDKPVPFKALDVPPAGLALYKAPGGALDRTLPKADWPIDVFEVKDGYLRVTGANTPGAAGLWAKAADLRAA